MRPIDVRKDLPAIVELIEVCFASQMDEDGKEYLRHLRRTAESYRYLHWMPAGGEDTATPMNGYVWEEHGRVVGNLTLIPFMIRGRWRYLIANVAVHPDFRQRGIGRRLTERAIQHAKERTAASAWLQVRDDNPVAHNLYRQIGFHERVRRSLWLAKTPVDERISKPALSVTPRRSTDWPQQESWLKQSYPPEVTWNLPLRSDRFIPGFMQGLFNWMNGEDISHWSARAAHGLAGVATLDRRARNSRHIWLAADPQQEDSAILALLLHIRRALPTSGLQVNYPAHHADLAFQYAGFERINTLIWMEYPLQP